MEGGRVSSVVEAPKMTLFQENYQNPDGCAPKKFIIQADSALTKCIKLWDEIAFDRI